VLEFVAGEQRCNAGSTYGPVAGLGTTVSSDAHAIVGTCSDPLPR
jgi:hypothetical protein